MDYKRVYDAIIDNARADKNNRVNGYYEHHHIVPRCVGGSNDDYNIVPLLPREHFVCHKLLVKIYNNSKLHFALWAMCNQTTKRLYRVSSHTYAVARANFRLANSIRHSKKTLSQEHKTILRIRMLSSDNPMKGKFGKDNPLFSRARDENVRNKISLTKRLSKKVERNKTYYTPLGEFYTVIEAAEAHNVSRDTILYRCVQRSSSSKWSKQWYIK